MSDEQGIVPTSTAFAAFLPPDYREGFSPEWIMGLSPFEDRTCANCYSVRDGHWVTFGPTNAEKRLFTCERAA